MTTMVAEVYDALVSAVASDEKARAAATAIAGYDQSALKADFTALRSEMATKADLAALRADMVALRADMATKGELSAVKSDLAAIKTDVAVVKRATGVIVAGLPALIVKSLL